MSSEIKRALLGRLAIHAGLVTQQQVIECLNEQQERLRARKKVHRLGEIFYEKGYLTKEQVRALLLYRKSVTAPLPPPENDISVIGDYEILNKLKTDATGTSYRARNKETEDIVALKIMSQEVMTSADFKERFVRETERGASLNHPGIERIITVGCKDNRYFYTSEYVEGSSLDRILDEKKKLSVEEAGRIARELAGALCHGHEKGIIHGDVRPSNIIITLSGNVKLAEFGVLKDALRNLMRLMGTTDKVGFYIAPEQAVGDRVIDESVDVYSLGAVYYHMLVGKPPFEGDSPLQSLVRLCEERFTPPHEVDESIPQAISDIIVKMVQAEPSGRQRTMAEVEKDLEGAGIPSAVDAEPVTVPKAAPVEAAAPEELVEPAATEPVKEMTARRELRRAHELRSAQTAASRWGMPIVVGSVLVILAVGLVALLTRSKPEEKTPVSSPAPAKVTEEVPSEEEKPTVAERPSRKKRPSKTDVADEEEDQGKDQEKKEPPTLAEEPDESETKPKPQADKEEDATFGRGGSLFAPVGWKPPKPSDKEEEEEEEEEKKEEVEEEKKEEEKKEEGEEEEKAWKSRVNKVLNEKKVSINFTDAPLSRVLKSIKDDRMEIDFVVDMGRDSDPLITISVNSMTLRNVLNWIATLSGTKWELKNKVIHFSKDIEEEEG